MRYAVIALATLAATVPPLAAQTPARGPEIRASIGAAVPTGGYRELFKGAPAAGIQAALRLAPRWRGVGALSWIAAESRFTTASDDWDHRVNVVQADVGIEVLGSAPLGRGWWAEPFVGAGGGVRLYDYRGRETPTNGSPEAYGGGGIALRQDRAAVRLEVRQHVFRFDPPGTMARAATHGDVLVLLGLTYQHR